MALNDIKRLTPRYNVRGFPSAPALHRLVLGEIPPVGAPGCAPALQSTSSSTGRSWDRQESRDQSCVMLWDSV